MNIFTGFLTVKDDFSKYGSVNKKGKRAEYTDDRAPHGGLRYGGQRHDNRGGYRLLREPAGGRRANGERKRDLLPGPAAARAVHGNL